MYQALYRKYRPKTLDEVCGQDTIIRIIKNSIKKNEINHAYLFTGPRGTGKTSVAKIFARIVNCENLKDCIPCGECSSCKESNNSDIIEIDAASNNGVDEIRELRNKVNLVPSYGKYKIYIIDEVHMLTVGAFNALLKTLEEPPTHVIFILATTDPQKIPETILSRCQRFDFKKISMDAIVENLRKISEKEKIEVEEDALYEIARLSDGGMRDSVGMLDQAKSYTDSIIKKEDIHDINGTVTENQLKDILESINEGKLEEILKKVDYFNEKGKNFTKITEEFINYLRNILLYQKIPNYFEKTEKNIENYDEISKKIDSSDIFKYIEIINKYLYEMKTSTNTKLMFELIFIQIMQEKEAINQEKSVIKEEINYKIPSNIKNTNSNVSEKIELETKNKQNNEQLKPITKIKNKHKEEFIEYIKKIRVDNTLSKFNKRTMIEIKNNLSKNLNNLLLNADYSSSSSMLLDGILKAASEENLIFVYKSDRVSYAFNENLLQIENTVEKALNKKYNLIAVNSDEWENIKDEFNNKKRKFIYKKEDFDIEEVLKVEPGDIISMFEDIIEYK